MPRWDVRSIMLVLYGVVWGAVVITTRVQGEPVTAEMLGLLAAGVVAIRLAFRRDDDPPEES